MQRTVFVFKMVKAEYSQLRDREFKVNFWHFRAKKRVLINVSQLNESWLKQNLLDNYIIFLQVINKLTNFGFRFDLEPFRLNDTESFRSLASTFLGQRILDQTRNIDNFKNGQVSSTVATHITSPLWLRTLETPNISLIQPSSIKTTKT